MAICNYLLHLNLHHHRMICTNFGWNRSVFLEKNIFLYRFDIMLYTCNLSLERAVAFLLEQDWFLITQRWSVPTFYNVFLLFCYYLYLEKGLTLHLHKFEYNPSKDSLCKLQLNWPRMNSFEERIFNRRYIFHMFTVICLILINLNFIHRDDALCQVLLKLTLWIWRFLFFILSTHFCYFCNYLPLEMAWHFI